MRKNRNPKLRKSLISSYILISLLIILSCGKVKKDDTAMAAYIDNHVEIINTANISRVAEIKEIINEGDTLKTSVGATVTFQIKDVGVIRVLPYSEVKIISIKNNDNTTIILKSGCMYSYILKGSGDYIIKTPNAVMQTIGTRFLVTHENDETTMPVQDGSVKVYASGNSRDWVAVREKNSAIISDDKKIEIIPISDLNEIKLQKLGLHPYIENIENKSSEELKEMFSGINKVERHMDMLTEDIVVMLRKDMLLRENDIQKERGEILKEEISIQLKNAINEQKLIQQQKEFFKNREAANEKEKKSLLVIAEREKDLELKKLDMQKERTKYQGDIKSFEDQIAKLEKEIQAEKHRISGEKQNVEKERDSIQSERDRIAKEIEAVKKEKENAQAERDSLKAERDKILHDIEVVQKEKELASQSEKKDEEQKFAKLEEQYKTNLAQLDAQNKTKMTDMEKGYKDKIAALEKQLQEKEKEKSMLAAASSKSSSDVVVASTAVTPVVATAVTPGVNVSAEQKELERKKAELELEKKRFEESKKSEMDKESARLREEQKELEKKRRELEEAKKTKEDTNEFPPLAKLKAQGKQIVSVKLKDGSVIKGAVDSQTERLLKLDVGDGIINIPVQEIVSRNAER